MPFQDLMRSATQKLKNLGFQPLDEGGGQRHGSWEWTWVKPRDKGGSRYVSVGAVDTKPGNYNMDVRAGADDGIRFCRVPVEEFENVSDGHLAEERKNAILSGLERAAEKACRLSESDLKDSYPRATSRL